MILAHFLNLSLGALEAQCAADSQTTLPRELAQRIAEVVERRCRSRKPLAYLLGEWEFYGLTLKLGEGVFVPRPETEVLVDVVLDELGDEPLFGIDVGTGCGAIAVALLSNRGSWRIAGTDTSTCALALARENARENGVGDRFFAVACDMAKAFGKADLVVSNPPYVPRSQFGRLPPEVRWEPREAIDGGDDGVLLIRRLVDEIERLSPVIAAFEISPDVLDRVEALLEGRGWRWRVIDDLSGAPRVVVVKRGGRLR